MTAGRGKEIEMTIDTRSATLRLADHTLGLRFEGLSAPVVQRTKELFLDFLGVALGGRLAESTGPLVQAVSRLRAGQPGQATVVGEGELYPPHYAALLNGALAHSLDFDDTYREGVLHPGAPVFATLLALAEAETTSGRQFLTAAVAGYEVSCRLARAHGSAVHHRGFHPTATTGIFGATAAGAHLLKLGPEALLDAWGLNLSQAAGSLQFLENGAWSKRVQVGLAASNAIIALVMAQEGVTGAAEPFSGRFGYYPCYAGVECDLEEALSGLGQEFLVMQTAVKPYPSCRYNHSVIDACLEFVARGLAPPADVQEVEIVLPPSGARIVAEPEERKRAPQNIVDAQFSVYFAAAVALQDGRFDWGSYRRIGDPAIASLMARMRAREASLPEMGAVVTIVSRGGRRYTLEVPVPTGEPERFPHWKELADKARSLARGTLPPDQVEGLMEDVARLDALEDMRDLTARLRPL